MRNETSGDISAERTLSETGLTVRGLEVRAAENCIPATALEAVCCNFLSATRLADKVTVVLPGSGPG